MKTLHYIAFILTVIGSLNWGLMGIGYFAARNWNVVNLLFVSWPGVEAVIYILVGLSALWLIIEHKKACKMCSAGATTTGGM